MHVASALWSGRFSLETVRSFPSTRRGRNKEAMVSLTKHLFEVVGRKRRRKPRLDPSRINPDHVQGYYSRRSLGFGFCFRPNKLCWYVAECDRCYDGSLGCLVHHGDVGVNA